MENGRKRVVEFLQHWVHSATAARGGQVLEYIPETYDLVEAGLIDSLQFVQLIEEIERQFGIQLDLTDADPEQLSSIAGLADAVAPALRSA